MDFRSVAVIRHPLPAAWAAMRDELPAVAEHLDDVEAIEVVEREEPEAGVIRFVNVWQAAPKLPAAIARHLRPDMLAWTDRASWVDAEQACTWTITPHYFGGSVHCNGATRFEPAMGGRGTRITFAGIIDWDELTGSGALSTVLTRGAETVALRAIPSVFQKLAQAVAAYLDEASPEEA